MTYDTYERMRREAQRAAAFVGTEPRQGVVTGYDPERYAVKVLVLPEGVFPQDAESNGETGWIPLGTAWAGNGWGDCAPPPIGTQVHINHQESSPGTGLVQHQLFDERHPPPQTPAGERWIQHQSGTYVKWTNAGELLGQGSANIHLTVGNQATIDVVDKVISITTGERIDIVAPEVNIVGTSSSTVNITVGASTMKVVDGSMTWALGGTSWTMTDGTVTVNVNGATLVMTSSELTSSVPIHAPVFFSATRAYP